MTADPTALFDASRGRPMLAGAHGYHRDWVDAKGVVHHVAHYTHATDIARHRARQRLMRDYRQLELEPMDTVFAVSYRFSPLARRCLIPALG
jgi:hypothetical protein